MINFDRVHIDVETYSEMDIRVTGAAKYARHKNTKLLVMKYAFNDGPILTYRPTDHTHYSDFPTKILSYITYKNYKMTAFNAFFEWNNLDPLPASVGIQARLCREDLLVEIEAVAMLKKTK